MKTMPMISKEIEDYAARHCTPESAIFSELVQVTHAKTDSPQMQVGRIEGAFLRVLTAAVRARRVLEVGTFTGYSTLCFAEALPEDGTVITCDINPETTAIARDYWSRSPHGKKIELKLGPAVDTIPKLTGEFDLAFIDADKENYPNYWDLIAPRIRVGGLVIIDNVLWSGSVVESDPDAETRAIMSASKKAASDPHFQTAMLTVRDGMLLAYRKS
jgi:caffeoyl-CoA O-methyltransferase